MKKLLSLYLINNFFKFIFFKLMNEKLNEKLEKFLKRKRNNNINNGYIKYKDIIEEKLK